MTSLRAELVRTLVVLAAPLGVVAIFPYASIGFTARPTQPPARPYVAFVRLTDAEHDSAMHAAKSAWQMEVGAARGRQVWLPLGELPEEAPGPILPSASLQRPAADWPRADYPAPAWMPSAAAPSPTRLVATPEKPVLPFSRSELLTLP